MGCWLSKAMVLGLGSTWSMEVGREVKDLALCLHTICGMGCMCWVAEIQGEKEKNSEHKKWFGLSLVKRIKQKTILR